MKSEIYLIRHAEASGNIDGVFQGSIDKNLSPKGYMQLALLSRRFSDIHIKKIYSSPKKRAKETAKAVSLFSCSPIITVDDLREINGGDFEGKKWDDLPRLFPNEEDKWRRFPHLFSAPHGETMCEVRDRMVKTVTRLANENDKSTIAIVSHGGSIRAFLCAVCEKSFNCLGNTDWCDNTGVTKLVYDGSCFKAIYKNDNSHLGSFSTLDKQDWWK